MNSISSWTWSSYRSALKAYTLFCCHHSISPLFPLTELSLARFAASLAQSRHSYGTIFVYISALRFMQLLPDPTDCSWPYLDQVLKGIRRSVLASVRSLRLPVTPQILRILFSVWSQPPVTPDNLMLRAACCVGFLWSGEFTCQSLAAAYSGSLQSPTDVAVDSHTHSTVVFVHLQYSKTDIFSVGAWVDMARWTVPFAQ